ncbi:hypothetical protein ScPMuIL_017531 [Solemya velum]
MKYITILILLLHFVAFSSELSKREIQNEAPNDQNDPANAGGPPKVAVDGEQGGSNGNKNTITKTTLGVAAPTKLVGKNSTDCKNSSCIEVKSSFMDTFTENKDMLMRTFYVLLGVTSIVIVYFAFRAWRLRRRRSKSRKYGLITGRGSDLEMAPLDQDDDEDDDMTTEYLVMNGETSSSAEAEESLDTCMQHEKYRYIHSIHMVLYGEKDNR